MPATEESVRLFVSELLAQIDGPGPDVVNDFVSGHMVGAICIHCQTIIAEPAGKITSPVVMIKNIQKSLPR